MATPTGPAVIDTGRPGGNNIVATEAARSLHAEDLLNGRSDEKAIERLNVLRPEARQITQVAQEGGLDEVKLAMFLKALAAAPRHRPRARMPCLLAAGRTPGRTRVDCERPVMTTLRWSH